MTVFANNPSLLVLALLVPAIALYLKKPRDTDSPLPSRSPAPSPASTRVSPLPALTTFRAHMLLMTILAILAVDFPIFPRELAKCETFGVSLMDVGVGAFVFAQGIVSALPILKDPGYLSAPALPKIISVARKTLPIIVLGVVRVALVKGTEYPEHVTEYGVHWNFFITLAALPVLQVFLHPLIARVSLSWLGVLVAMIQQALLTVGGLEQYVLHAPRTGLISQNKEGVMSLLGYLSIHLLGLATGTLILPPSPSYFRRTQREKGTIAIQATVDEKDKTVPRLAQPREDDKTATELFGYTLLWWASFYISRYFKLGGEDASRRMVNLSYVFWVAAYNTTALLGYFVLDLVFFPCPARYSPTSKLKRTPARAVREAPPLLEAVNKNGLTLFLLANVLTGCINFAVKTMYASDAKAMAILSGYAAVVCWVAWTFRRRRLVQL